MHPFTRAGMGQSPFRLLSIRDAHATDRHGTCRACGHKLRWEYLIESRDGIRSTVGCNCVRRIKDVDAGLARAVSEARKEWERGPLVKAAPVAQPVKTVPGKPGFFRWLLGI